MNDVNSANNQDATSELSNEQADESISSLKEDTEKSLARRNISIALTIGVMTVIGSTGGWSLVLDPILVYLKASDTLIGIVKGGLLYTLAGIFIAPWISRRFVYKKWLIFLIDLVVWVPCIVIGLAILFQHQMNLTSHFVLMFFVIIWLFTYLAAGFSSVPRQEMIAACIPAAYMGRYSGLVSSISGGIGIAAAAAGGLIMKNIHPEAVSYGIMFLWGCGISLLAVFLYPLYKERPCINCDTPNPWSKGMLTAVWENKPFMRLVGINALAALTYGPVLMFIPVYALKQLHLLPAKIAIISIITQIVSLSLAAPTGFFIDRFGVKRLLPPTIFGVLAAIKRGR